MVHMIGAEKLMFNEKLEPFYRRTTSKNGDYIDIQPENCFLPMLKELVVQVVLKREGYSPTMEKKVWFGVQTLQIKIPDERIYKYHYLCYNKTAMGNICVKLVDPYLRDTLGNYNSTCWDFNLGLKPLSTESYEFSWIKRIGKAKTISAAKAQIMLRDKEAIALLSDNGQEQCL